ncbi:MAG: hypothetical protein ACRCW6_01300 [Mycoplasmoidaceae bacterium]
MAIVCQHNNFNHQKDSRLITLIEKNMLDASDQYFYRPVGFKGTIDFENGKFLKIIGLFCFDAWMSFDDGTTFLNVTIGDQSISKIPIHQQVASAVWKKNYGDKLWEVPINLSIDISDSKLFNSNMNDNVNINFSLDLNDNVWQGNIDYFYSNEDYQKLIVDIKENVFSSAFTFCNSFNLVENKTINIMNKIVIDSFNLNNQLIKEVDKKKYYYKKINVNYPDFKKNHSIDNILEFSLDESITIELDYLNYIITKSKNNDVSEYVYKSDSGFSQKLIGKNIYFKNKLVYYYDPSKNDFDATSSNIGTFIFEKCQQIKIKGEMILKIAGIKQYIYFENSTVPVFEKVNLKIEKI